MKKLLNEELLKYLLISSSFFYTYICIYIIYFSKNISSSQAVLRVFFGYDTVMETVSIPIADELYLLGKNDCFSILRIDSKI